jgi:hypothetical protein
MTDKPGLDRRDFMIASTLATVGGAAMSVVLSSDHAKAQTATAELSRGTVYTGEQIQGKKAISALDVNDLEAGQKHLLYFQGVETPTGQHWYVSVTVARGGKSWQARRVDKRCAWRRDEFHSYGSDRDEPT